VAQLFPAYLLVNHVQFARRNEPGHYEVGDLWLQDLRAQAKAIRDAGMRLIVATPCVDPPIDPGFSGSFSASEIHIEQEDFDYIPLPFYKSMAQYLLRRRAIVAALRNVMADVDIVQAGYGGHPVALGSLAWPIAGHVGTRRIWVFDGADPIPRLRLEADQARNPIKRVAKRYGARRFEQFCRDAVREADLVFAHNAAVVERFKDVWDSQRCHAFDRSFVTDETLIDAAELAKRQRRIRDVSHPLRLVIAGRQIGIKGTDHVLRAMRQAIDRGARLELDVWGDGEDLVRFKMLAIELRLDAVVRFRGTVAYGKPLFDAWAEGQVMAITNLTAEISRNVLLGMARGMPLIAYRNPGTDELIHRSGAGILVPTGDVNALAGALEQASRDRETLASMCAAGVSAAKDNTLGATHRRRAELAFSMLART
jgi:glycosyltransferase involved in cell wall biosynthesis